MAKDRSKADRWVLGAMLALPSLALGELTVIYDSGHTLPLTQYLEVFEEGFDREERPQASPVPPTPPELGAANLERLLPIESSGLTPGPVVQRTMKRPFARPFFLIGSDPASREWLATHRDRLDEIGAVGMLVEARTVEDVRAITDLARGLPILPASASDIAEALYLSHYPVLITTDGLEQ